MHPPFILLLFILFLIPFNGLWCLTLLILWHLTPFIIILRKIIITITSGCGPPLTYSGQLRIFIHIFLKIERIQRVKNRKSYQYVRNYFLAELPSYLVSHQKRQHELYQKVACHGKTSFILSGPAHSSLMLSNVPTLYKYLSNDSKIEIFTWFWVMTNLQPLLYLIW